MYVYNRSRSNKTKKEKENSLNYARTINNLQPKRQMYVQKPQQIENYIINNKIYYNLKSKTNKKGIIERYLK